MRSPVVSFYNSKVHFDPLLRRPTHLDSIPISLQAGVRIGQPCGTNADQSCVVFIPEGKVSTARGNNNAGRNNGTRRDYGVRRSRGNESGGGGGGGSGSRRRPVALVNVGASVYRVSTGQKLYSLRSHLREITAIAVRDATTVGCSRCVCICTCHLSFCALSLYICKRKRIF